MVINKVPVRHDARHPEPGQLRRRRHGPGLAADLRQRHHPPERFAPQRQQPARLPLPRRASRCSSCPSPLQPTPTFTASTSASPVFRRARGGRDHLHDRHRYGRRRSPTGSWTWKSIIRPEPRSVSSTIQPELYRQPVAQLLLGLDSSRHRGNVYGQGRRLRFDLGRQLLLECRGGHGHGDRCAATPAQYNFESGAQGWVSSGGIITGVASSTAKAFAGTHCWQ